MTPASGSLGHYSLHFVSANRARLDRVSASLSLELWEMPLFETACGAAFAKLSDCDWRS